MNKTEEIQTNEPDEYTIVYGPPQAMQERVSRLLRQKWRLYESPFTYTKSDIQHICQAMVR